MAVRRGSLLVPGQSATTGPATGKRQNQARKQTPTPTRRSALGTGPDRGGSRLLNSSRKRKRKRERQGSGGADRNVGGSGRQGGSRTGHAGGTGF